MTPDLLSLVHMCRACESGFTPPAWPDGKALLDQPTKLVRAFGLIRSLAPFYEKGK